MTKITKTRCPACFKSTPEFKGEAGAGNSMSRYVDIWICSDCGTREAFEGFFWSAHCPGASMRIAAKKRGISIKQLAAMCVAGFVLLAAQDARAYTFTSRGPFGGYSTTCTRYNGGMTCNTIGLGSIPTGPRILHVEPQDDAPGERTETDADRILRHRDTCKSPSVKCLDAEPAW